MSEQFLYGSREPIMFVLSTFNAPTTSLVGVEGITLLDADVLLYLDGALYSVDDGEIGSECTEVGSGIYQWTPQLAAQMQCKQLQLVIKDTAGSAFVDNKLFFKSGGHINAYYGSLPI